ncbi:hypothetical protein [Dyella sp.]|uniref:hypothetical protein n=1 Tax=Dyella sp. TaxID=1869338 RepID=UPI0028443896|nr:hypothetical protein [Dyella sp.]MDR3445980.1 hypothetical protein [Dyella sp.]
MATRPLVQQGTLNRVRTSVVLPNFTNLNVTAPYMGKSMARLAFEGPFGELIGTATGGVTSPEPYVMATLSIALLRTQALASQWLEQCQVLSNVGPVTTYSDSAAFDAITLDNCVVTTVDPGAWDGTDPVVRYTLRGIFYVNNDLWNI